jgi:hypothetical protein
MLPVSASTRIHALAVDGGAVVVDDVLADAGSAKKNTRSSTTTADSTRDRAEGKDVRIARQ